LQGVSRFWPAVFPVVQGEAAFASGGLPTAEDAVFPIESGDTSPCVPGVVIENCSTLRLALSRAAAKHAKPGQIALAWLLQKGDDMVPIPGTNRRKYLEENVAAETVQLDPAQMKVLDDALTPGKSLGQALRRLDQGHD
jgi:aryl-alcohol dehydrogenase-like predicted oxidoreductase